MSAQHTIPGSQLTQVHTREVLIVMKNDYHHNKYDEEWWSFHDNKYDEVWLWRLMLMEELPSNPGEVWGDQGWRLAPGRADSVSNIMVMIIMIRGLSWASW